MRASIFSAGRGKRRAQSDGAVAGDLAGSRMASDRLSVVVEPRIEDDPVRMGMPYTPGKMGLLRLSYALHPNPMKGRMSNIFDAPGHLGSANLGEDGRAPGRRARAATLIALHHTVRFTTCRA